MNGAIITALPPAQAQHALLTELAALGAEVRHQTPGTISGVYTVRGRPSVAAAIILFLICIIPGVIYLIAASKDTVEPFHIELRPDGTGTAIWPSGSQAAAIAAQRINTTPEGWYPDPSGRNELRWHNGTTWTNQVSNQGTPSYD